MGPIAYIHRYAFYTKMPLRSNGSYRVKKTAPLAPGYLKLDTNGMGSSYMGRDEDLNVRVTV